MIVIEQMLLQKLCFCRDVLHEIIEWNLNTPIQKSLPLLRFPSYTLWQLHMTKWQISLQFAILTPIKTIFIVPNIQHTPQLWTQNQYLEKTAGNSQLQFTIMLIANDKRLPVTTMTGELQVGDNTREIGWRQGWSHYGVSGAEKHGPHLIS